MISEPGVMTIAATKTPWKRRKQPMMLAEKSKNQTKNSEASGG